MSEQDLGSNQVLLGEAVDGHRWPRLETDESHLALAGDGRQREGDVVVGGVGVSGTCSERMDAGFGPSNGFNSTWTTW